MLKQLQANAKPILSQVVSGNTITDNIQPQAQKAYLQLMMQIISRGLVSASETDDEVRAEASGFRIGQTIQMTVLPNVAQFTLQVTEKGTFRTLPEQAQKADLVIKFKHMSLAFLVLTFQESTAISFARDRMVADGDISDAIRFVRCLNRLEVLILPKIIAKLAVKDYPSNLSIKEKLQQGSKVYAGVVKSFFNK